MTGSQWDSRKSQGKAVNLSGGRRARHALINFADQVSRSLGVDYRAQFSFAEVGNANGHSYRSFSGLIPHLTELLPEQFAASIDGAIFFSSALESVAESNYGARWGYVNVGQQYSIFVHQFAADLNYFGFLNNKLWADSGNRATLNFPNILSALAEHSLSYRQVDRISDESRNSSSYQERIFKALVESLRNITGSEGPSKAEVAALRRAFDEDVGLIYRWVIGHEIGHLVRRDRPGRKSGSRRRAERQVEKLTREFWNRIVECVDEAGLEIFEEEFKADTFATLLLSGYFRDDNVDSNSRDAVMQRCFMIRSAGRAAILSLISQGLYADSDWSAGAGDHPGTLQRIWAQAIVVEELCLSCPAGPVSDAILTEVWSLANMALMTHEWMVSPPEVVEVEPEWFLELLEPRERER